MPETGHCECGAVTYAVTGDEPIHVYACHCRNCQTRSGSAFAEHAMVAAAAFAIAGELNSYRREANGMQFEESVCRTCYTRIFNRNSALPGSIFLRAGTLSGSEHLEPMAHIWVKRKQPWIHLKDDVPAFAESPTPEEFGAAIAAARSRGTV
ncbi:GFA family protein [Haliangium ochraceum]|uniref:Glutathione-dependent formaldehyde-activating GFA n=1 Tax=Haliangium ochraceum (strain DSM 14365 / JCM 11303 / SMP-2) TaxID=502025 RepID=D0LMM1_HALO1|nr:GFA family protein [Haliangium ochraceum]ACY18708.1 glutathione-dependent formaldehyde-activating GFA [Haliangium ochraceum DSM 14365]